MAWQRGPARRPGSAPLGWKEVQARPLARAACHSLPRPPGRDLAVTGSAQARNVTREKPEQGPRLQVVIFGGSAPRILLSCHRKASRSPLPTAAACAGAYKERRAAWPECGVRLWPPSAVQAAPPRSFAGRRAGEFRETSACQ